MTDKFELDIIELLKIKGRENEKDQLLDWLIFLENPESERVTRKMEENENLKEAVEKLDRISEDEKMQRIIELREKAIRDEHAIYAKGLDDGVEKGAREKQIEIAKSMLKENMDIEIIIKITGLTKEEIEKLKEKLKEIDYMNLKEQYNVYGTGNYEEIAINLEGNKKKIRLDYIMSRQDSTNLPKELNEFMRLFKETIYEKAEE